MPFSLPVDSGYKVLSRHIEGWWKDAGKPEDILEVNRLMLDEILASNERKVQYEAAAVGIVKVGKGRSCSGSRDPGRGHDRGEL